MVLLWTETILVLLSRILIDLLLDSNLGNSSQLLLLLFCATLMCYLVLEFIGILSFVSGYDFSQWQWFHFRVVVMKYFHSQHITKSLGKLLNVERWLEYLAWQTLHHYPDDPFTVESTLRLGYYHYTDLDDINCGKQFLEGCT